MKFTNVGTLKVRSNNQTLWQYYIWGYRNLTKSQKSEMCEELFSSKVKRLQFPNLKNLDTVLILDFLP